MAQTYTQQLAAAKAVLDARLAGGAVDRYIVNGTDISKIDLKDLMALIDWLEQKAGNESAATATRPRHNYLGFGGPT